MGHAVPGAVGADFPGGRHSSGRGDRRRVAGAKTRRGGRWVAVRAFLIGFVFTTPQSYAETGYLAGHEVDFRTFLGPPPAPDSQWDRADQGLVEALQAVDDRRWQMADQDGKELYSRFAGAFGRPIDKKTAPVLVKLLDRAVADADATADVAKDFFSRPRPFQRLQLQRVCDKATPPKPEEHPTRGTSYPSGHSTRGWTVAMVLARVAPDRAEVVLKRAEEYMESRLICGMHFPSDVEAGHDVAIAVVSHLDASPQFQADLERARKEHMSP